MRTTICQYSGRKSWSSSICREEIGAWRYTEKRSKQMEPVCNRHSILVSTGRHKVEYFLCNLFASHKIAVCDNTLQSVIARNWEETYRSSCRTTFPSSICTHASKCRTHLVTHNMESLIVARLIWAHELTIKCWISEYFCAQKCLAVKEGNRKSSNPWHWHDQHCIWERIKRIWRSK
jgi:hypothetical protein